MAANRFPRSSGPPPTKVAKVDRTNTCPFLLRTFVKVGGHHTDSEFDGKVPSVDEYQLYTWRDSSLKEIILLLRDNAPALRNNPFARYSVRLVYFDTPSASYISRDLGNVSARDVIAPGGGEDTRNTFRPTKTLDDYRFVIGDYIDVAYLTADRVATYSERGQTAAYRGGFAGKETGRDRLAAGPGRGGFSARGGSSGRGRGAFSGVEDGARQRIWASNALDSNAGPTRGSWRESRGARQGRAAPENGRQSGDSWEARAHGSARSPEFRKDGARDVDDRSNDPKDADDWGTLPRESLDNERRNRRSSRSASPLQRRTRSRSRSKSFTPPPRALAMEAMQT